MAHYAFLDENNIVTEVIVGKDEDQDGGNWEVRYGDIRGHTCKRTSYNTHGNVHRLDGTAFRGNYAGKGYTYDASKDAFIPPQPFDSWTLNDSTHLWEPPVAMPDGDKIYEWNESNLEWDEY
jgi:hypothetical protein